jgi:hypothetical protein
VSTSEVSGFTVSPGSAVIEITRYTATFQHGPVNASDLPEDVRLALQDWLDGA